MLGVQLLWNGMPLLLWVPAEPLLHTDLFQLPHELSYDPHFTNEKARSQCLRHDRRRVFNSTVLFPGSLYPTDKHGPVSLTEILVDKVYILATCYIPLLPKAKAQIWPSTPSKSSMTASFPSEYHCVLQRLKGKGSES